MTHQYKIGDKVRIKERKGNSNDYPYGFTDEMAQQKDKIFTIERIEMLSQDFKKDKFYNGDNHYYIFAEDKAEYWWHSSMFESVFEDSERQTSTFLKKGDLLPICGIIGKIQFSKYSERPGYYLGFNGIKDTQEHHACCIKLRELVPNFDKIANEYDPIKNESGFFPEFSTIDDLVKFTEAVNNTYNSKKSITITKTLNENEIRFQKPKTSVIRGSVPTGCAISGRRYKTAIELGHLSNTTCYC